MRTFMVVVVSSLVVAACGTGVEPGVDGADVPAPEELSAANDATGGSVEQSLVTDCTVRSTRTDGYFPWCYYRTSSNGTVYIKNGSGQGARGSAPINIVFKVIGTSGNPNRACCVARNSKFNAGPSTDVSYVSQASSQYGCTNVGHCTRL